MMPQRPTRSRLHPACISIRVYVFVLLSAACAAAEPLAIRLQDIEVTVRKRPEAAQSVPGSMTVRTVDELDAAGMTDLRAAARGVPNLTRGMFTTRRLTFPYVRGIGSGQNAPGVTTYIDGVPQLSYVTGNQELMGVERIEFQRGPRGALYGANSIGGVINIVPRLPAAKPAGSVDLVTGSRDQLGLKPTARTHEEHLCPSISKLVGDRHGRDDVSRRTARRHYYRRHLWPSFWSVGL